MSRRRALVISKMCEDLGFSPTFSSMVDVSLEPLWEGDNCDIYGIDELMGLASDLSDDLSGNDYVFLERAKEHGILYVQVNK